MTSLVTIRRLALLALLVMGIAALLPAQIKPAVGIRQNTPSVHAFTNARIVVSPGAVIDKGTLVMRDGVITAVGKNAAVPGDARVWDMTGMTLYPGLIDSYSDLGMPKKPSATRPFLFHGFGCKTCPAKFRAEPEKYGEAALKNQVVE